MAIINNKESLVAWREAAKAKGLALQRTKTLVNVSCGTCGLASGADEVWKTMHKAAEECGLDSVEFIRSGCMTYCYAEPTVTITRPEAEPVTFGHVDEKRAKALVEKFITQGEMVEGEIPINYERVLL